MPSIIPDSVLRKVVESDSITNDDLKFIKSMIKTCISKPNISVVDKFILFEIKSAINIILKTRKKMK